MNFLAKIISFGMERTFVKRDSKNQKLIAGGTLSPILMDYIMDSEVPRPCRHFCGRNTEIDELHTQLESNDKVFLYGITGIGKSEMEKGIFLLEQYQLFCTNDSIPQINNSAVLLTEIQEPEQAMSVLQKPARIIKNYNSDHCLDYAQVQESMGNICLITADISKSKTHFKKSMKIYEDVRADEPELIEEIFLLALISVFLSLS